ncbi:MAG: hypothetical protein U0271_17130 [Polyangiaceae bacterium]
MRARKILSLSGAVFAVASAGAASLVGCTRDAQTEPSATPATVDLQESKPTPSTTATSEGGAVGATTNAAAVTTATTATANQPASSAAPQRPRVDRHGRPANGNVMGRGMPADLRGNDS